MSISSNGSNDSVLSWLQFGGQVLQGVSTALDQLGKNVVKMTNDYAKQDQEAKHNMSTWTPDIESKFVTLCQDIKKNYILNSSVLLSMINNTKYIHVVGSTGKMMFSARSEGILFEAFCVTDDFARDKYVAINIINGSIVVDKMKYQAHCTMFWLYELNEFLRKLGIPTD